MAVATVQDLADYLGVGVDTLPGSAAFVVDLAGQLVLDAAPHLASASPPPPAALAVTLAVAARALANPAGYVTETNLGYSVRYAENALALTVAERASLAATAPGGAAAAEPWSGTVHTPLAGRR